MTQREINKSKGDAQREKRLAEALRANLLKRKARAQAVASENKAQDHARRVPEGVDKDA